MYTALHVRNSNTHNPILTSFQRKERKILRNLSERNHFSSFLVRRYPSANQLHSRAFF